jgi:hypothetical protein
LSVLSCGGGVPYGRIDFGTIDTEGQVDTDYFKAQLGQLEPRFQACYARTLVRNRTAEGRVRLAIQGGGGRLVPTVVENATSDSGLVQCVTGAISELKIVEREGSVPWHFTAEWDMGFEIARRPARAASEGS